MKQASDLNSFEELIKPGTRCEVRRRFDDSFAKGFEVAEVIADGYRVRRLSDGSVLPVVFAPEDLRKERKKQGMWWA